MRLIKMLLLLILLQPGFSNAGSDSLEIARLHRVRDGLPFFFKKIKAGQSVRIGYLGGSITEAALGWRDQSLDWLRTKYPSSGFFGINAGVGGTGSELGVFRVQSQVLSSNPDLVFVEFAVNDNGKDTEQIYKAMEGIVRKVWQHNSRTDICFVYTLTADMAIFFQNGKLPPSALAMERIAQHYGIPTVCMGLKVAELAKEGGLIFKGKPQDYPDKIVFSADNVHPYPQTGHLLYTESLAEALGYISVNNSGILEHNLPKPFRSNNWQQAQLLPLTAITRQGQWQELDVDTDTTARLLKNRFPTLLKSAQPGSYLEVKVKGQAIGLYDVMGPGCGQYSIEIDGEERQTISRFDGYSTYYRANFFVLPLPSENTHVIRLKVSDQKPDKENILKMRNQVLANPAHYIENACYAGQLLLIGELIP